MIWTVDTDRKTILCPLICKLLTCILQSDPIVRNNATRNPKHYSFNVALLSLWCLSSSLSNLFTFTGKPSELYRNRMGAFGVSGELATRPVSSLSGGQKSRVAFALIDMLKWVSIHLYSNFHAKWNAKPSIYSTL